MKRLKRGLRVSAACLAIVFAATACLPMSGQTIHETHGPDWTYLTSKVWNTDQGIGIHAYDKWTDGAAGEAPYGYALRICDYQGMRVWASQGNVPNLIYFPTMEFTGFHSGCSFWGKKDYPDAWLHEGIVPKGHWGSNHTNGHFWPIGTHKYALNNKTS